MEHTIIYMGNMARSFATLSETTSTYLDAGGIKKRIDEPSPKADGLIFAYMERRPKLFFAVRVYDPVAKETVVLREPVLLVTERHTDGKGFSPTPSRFGDDSALHLLVDMIVSNPEYRDLLGAMVQRLGASNALSS